MQIRGAHLKEVDSGCAIIPNEVAPENADQLGTYMDPEGKIGRTDIITPASQKQLMAQSQTSRSLFKAKPN